MVAVSSQGPNITKFKGLRIVRGSSITRVEHIARVDHIARVKHIAALERLFTVVLRLFQDSYILEQEKLKGELNFSCFKHH